MAKKESLQPCFFYDDISGRCERVSISTEIVGQMLTINNQDLVAEVIRKQDIDPNIAINLIQICSKVATETNLAGIAPFCPAFKTFRKKPQELLSYQRTECVYCWTGDTASAIRKPIERLFVPIALEIESAEAAAAQMENEKKLAKLLQEAPTRKISKEIRALERLLLKN